MRVDDKTSSVVEVISVFSFVPPSGYAPLRVKAVNNTGADLTVAVNTVAEGASNSGNAHELESRFSFTAPAGKTTEREFLVPLCTNFRLSPYSVPGLRTNILAGDRSDTFRFNCGGYGGLPFTAFSSALAAKTIGDINSAAGSTGSGYRYGNENFAGLYDPAQLSADWRAYSGLDVLAMSSDEWAVLQSGVKSAVLQWVKLGGSLNIYSKAGGQGLTTLNIPVQGRAGQGPGYGGDAYALGNGRVCDIQWDGIELDAGVATDYQPATSGGLPAGVRRQEYGSALSSYEPETRNSRSSPTPTPLVAALGEKNFAAWQVGVILFIFGIVVGPVNLFYFAGRGRRHRLFFTTPVISLAAAALLLLVIFFQDGTGGRGSRASLVYLDAGENAAFIHQMQVSRTGVLFGSAFTLEDAAVLNMALLPESRWTRLKGGSHHGYYGYSSSSRSEPQRYSIQEKNCGGDWFQSRSEQAQFVDAVQSTRGRIDLKPGSNPPAITSTIPATLERVCYLDDSGKYWGSSDSVTTGADVVLTEISGQQFHDWRDEALSMLPSELRPAIATHSIRNFFYAASSDPAAGIVETLDSIKWENSTVFLYGPLK
jgi:hypothetical protein